MSKQTGMGDRLFIDGYDVAGDVNSVSNLHGGPAPWDVTGIDKSAPERLGLLRDGAGDFVSFFNDQNTAPLGAFQVLKTLPTTDRQVSYWHTGVLGGPACSMVTKQINYDGNRGQDGSFTFATSVQECDGNGLAWGFQLTAGKRTDTTATSPATGVDLTQGVGTFSAAGAPSSVTFGWAAFLHVFSFTGTSVTVTVQDSADNAAFTSLTGGAFTAATALGSQRLAGSTTATVRRYARVITTGTFTNAVFAVNFVPFLTAQA